MPKQAKRKIKVVLSGSGTRYPCFIGALWRLLQENYEITEICGTSGGALVAAKFASIYDGVLSDDEVVKELLLSTSKSLPGPLLDLNYWQTAFSFNPVNLFRKDKKVFGLNTKGIFKGKKITRALAKELPGSFSETKIPVHIVTFNNNIGVHNIWSKKDNVSLVKAVRASMSLPLIFDPVEINGDIHTDGGITANFPLDVFGTDTDVIGFRFGSSGPTRRDIRSKLDIAQANIDGAIEAAMKEDIEDAGLKSRICYLQTKHSGLNLYMSEKDIVEQMWEGYVSCDKWLKLEN